jgi:hypothetical protein
MCELSDYVPRKEDLASGDGCQDAGDRRVAAVAEAHHEVLDPSESPACAPHDLAAEDQREVKDTPRLRCRSHGKSPVAPIAKDYAARGRSPRGIQVSAG